MPFVDEREKPVDRIVGTRQRPNQGRRVQVDHHGPVSRRHPNRREARMSRSSAFVSSLDRAGGASRSR